MRFVLASAAAAVLVLASRGAADVPLPPNLKYFEPQLAFEGVGKHPDTVFYLRFKTFTGGPAGVPYTTIEVKDDKAFVLKAQRRIIDFKLLAVERKDFERRAKDAPTLAWLSDKATGVQAASLPTPTTVGDKTLKELPVSTYKVTLKDGKLSVEPPSPFKTATPRTSAPVANWAAGILAAAGLAWIGLWWTRRT